MSIALDHTIVWSSDRKAASDLFAEIYGLPSPRDVFHFRVVSLENGTNLDFADKDGTIAPQHYAMRVSEAEFDGILSRIRNKNLPHWADPARHRPNEINHNDGGRGVYFEGPDGHFFEALTVPYGGMPGKNDA